MMTSEEWKTVLETVMSTPGMSEAVKIDFKISRKNVLLLCSVIQHGLGAKDGTVLAGAMQKESVDELQGLASECLQKAGLTELYQKLTALDAKGGK